MHARTRCVFLQTGQCFEGGKGSKFAEDTQYQLRLNGGRASHNAAWVRRTGKQQGSSAYTQLHSYTHYHHFSPSIQDMDSPSQRHGGVRQGYPHSKFPLFMQRQVIVTQQLTGGEEGIVCCLPTRLQQTVHFFGLWRWGWNRGHWLVPACLTEEEGQGAQGQGVHFQHIPYLQLPHVS